MGAIISQIKQYKRDTILALIFVALEVCMEVMIPFITYIKSRFKVRWLLSHK